MTGLVTVAYAGLVLLATQMFSFHTPVAVAASTLTAAVLFNLPRRRLQRAVNRRFHAWHDTVVHQAGISPAVR